MKIKSSQTNTILGATEYCLQSIQNLKRGMLDLGGKNQKVSMAIGGVIITMLANFLKISFDVIEEGVKNPDPSAINDVKEIQAKFNDFLTKMIGEEE